MGKKVLRISCILAAVLICSCVKNQKPVAAQNAADAAMKTAEAPRTPLAQPEATAGAESGAAPSPPKTQPLPVKSGSGLQALLTLRADSSVLPEDFRIGPLAGAKDLAGDEAAAGAAAAAFLGGLTKGRIAAEQVSPAAAFGVSDSIAHRLSEGMVPSAFRLGRPVKRSGGEYAFNVRLFKDDGSAEGEIYIGQSGRKWAVTDLQVDLSRLGEKRTKPENKFFPTSYRWLLGE